MDINLGAILLDNTLICFTLGFVMLLFAFFHKRYNGYLLISSAYFCIGIALLIPSVKLFPPEISIITANTLASCSLLLIYIGTERFRGQQHKQISSSLLILFAILLSSFIFSAIIPDIKTCDTIFSILISVQLALCVWAALRNTKTFKSYQLILSAALIVMILSFFHNIYTVISSPDTLHSFETSWPNWPHLFAYPFSFILSSFAFTWGSVERAELEKDKQVAILENNYLFMDVLLDAIPLPVFHKDLEMRYCHINQAFSEAIGLSKGQIIGKTTMEIIPEKIMNLSRNYDIAILETGKTQEYETAFPFPDGLQHEVQIKKKAFINSQGKIAGIVGAFTDITERKIYEAKIKHLALHDQVTGLPNRNMFYTQLNKSIALAKRNGYTVALLYIDLDGFKAVNDTYGHDAGDTLLRTIGKKLITTIRESDTACRIGGDEFTVLTEMYHDPADVKIVAEKIRKALSEPSTCEGLICQTSASIGIALYPQDAESSRELVKAADKAMYNAKNKGKNQVCFYNSQNS